MKNNLAVALAVAALAASADAGVARASVSSFETILGLSSPDPYFGGFDTTFVTADKFAAALATALQGGFADSWATFGASVVNIYGGGYLFSLTLQAVSTSSDQTSGSIDVNSTALSNGWYLGASFASAVTADCIGVCSTSSPVSDYVVTGYTSVPGPSVGAGLPAVLIGFAGLLGWRRIRGGSGQEQVRR